MVFKLAVGRPFQADEPVGEHGETGIALHHLGFGIGHRVLGKDGNGKYEQRGCKQDSTHNISYLLIFGENGKSEGGTPIGDQVDIGNLLAFRRDFLG